MPFEPRYDAFDQTAIQTATISTGGREEPLSVNHPEADELAHALEERMGESVDEAVIKSSPRASRADTRASQRRPPQRPVVEDWKRMSGLDRLHLRPADEIVGYDEYGVPLPPMAVGFSAVLALLLGEDDAPFYANAIEEAGEPLHVHRVRAGGFSRHRARKRAPGLAAFDRFLGLSRIRVVAFYAEQLLLAGGRGGSLAKAGIPRPSTLATAGVTRWQKRIEKRLLYKGNDLTHTDVLRARPMSEHSK